MNSVNKYDILYSRKGKENPTNQKGKPVMKSLYKCEICGKVFDEYEEAYSCENGHYVYNEGWDWDDKEEVKEEVKKHIKYGEGNPVPEQIAIILRHDEYENGEYRVARTLGIYKLVKQLPQGYKNA